MSHKKKPEHQRNNPDISVPDATEPVSQQHAGESRKKLYRWIDAMKKWSWSNIIQTLIFVVGAIYAGVTYLLWQTQKEQIHSGQRAYVLVTEVRPPQNFAPNQLLMVGVHAINTGQTPALGVRMGCHLELREFGTGEPTPRNEYLKAIGSVADFGTGNGQTCGANLEPDGRVITEAEYARVLNRGLNLFVVATINYKDVFDSFYDPLHYTMFCAFYEPAINGFGPCHTGNYIAPQRNPNARDSKGQR